MRRPVVPAGCTHNAHMYYLLLGQIERGHALIDALRARQIMPSSTMCHFTAPAAAENTGRSVGRLTATTELSGRLVRLPLWADMTDVQVDRVADAVVDFYARPRSPRARGRISSRAPG